MYTRVLGIDPGTSESAYVIFDGVKVLEHGYLANAAMKQRLTGNRYDVLAIERVQFYGKGGCELTETIEWIGRFDAECEAMLILRTKIRAHLCGTSKSGDPEVRAAILDRFGGRKQAQGTAKSPGPLYGIAKHNWAALAVCIVAYDQLEREALCQTK
jgi:hypothetical protein